MDDNTNQQDQQTAPPEAQDGARQSPTPTATTDTPPNNVIPIGTTGQPAGDDQTQEANDGGDKPEESGGDGEATGDEQEAPLGKLAQESVLILQGINQVMLLFQGLSQTRIRHIVMEKLEESTLWMDYEAQNIKDPPPKSNIIVPGQKPS